MCPHLTKEIQKEVSQISNHNLPHSMLQGGLKPPKKLRLWFWFNSFHCKRRRCLGKKFKPYTTGFYKECILNAGIWVGTFTKFEYLLSNQYFQTWGNHITDLKLHSLSHSIYLLIVLTLTGLIDDLNLIWFVNKD